MNKLFGNEDNYLIYRLFNASIDEYVYPNEWVRVSYRMWEETGILRVYENYMLAKVNWELRYE